MVVVWISVAGIRVNVSKIKFIVEYIEYLGYWISQQGIQPVHKKMEVVLTIKASKLEENNASLLVLSTITTTCDFET